MTTSNPSPRSDPLSASHLGTILGLSAAPFHAALGAGAVAFRGATPHHAANAAGTFFYHEALATLRDELSRMGWRSEQSGNLEYAVHPDGRHRIFVLAGDSNTGDPLAIPHSRRPRGSQGKEQVIQGQLEMLLADLGVGSAAPERVTTWALLHYLDVKRDLVRGELSVPANMNSAGCVTQWRPRILLPPLDLGAGRLANLPAGSPAVSLEVRRKGT